MPRPILALRTTCAALASACALAHAAATPPPVAAVKPVTDTYHGVTVTDSYRYMEDLAAPEVQQWARAQADHARSTLDAIPGRAALLARIRELDASVKERVLSPVQAGGGLVFFEKRKSGEQQLKLYVRKGFKGEERLLVDPDAQGGGVPHAIEFFQPSNNGRLLAYGVSAGGSEEAVIHVMDVATGKAVMAPIDRAQFSYVAWLPDDSGFVYLRLQALPDGAPNSEKLKNSGVWLHRMAGKAADTLVLGAGVNAALPVALADFPMVQPVAGTPWMLGLSGQRRGARGGALRRARGRRAQREDQVAQAVWPRRGDRLRRRAWRRRVHALAPERLALQGAAHQRLAPGPERRRRRRRTGPRGGRPHRRRQGRAVRAVA